MSVAEVLRPALDALAPAEETSAMRRVRTAAAWLAIASWLLPPFAPLGTDAPTRRGAMCAGFVVTGVLAHVLRKRDGGWKATLAAAALAAAIVAVAGRGATWGLWFTAFAAVVFGLTQARRRLAQPVAPWFEHDPLPPRPGGIPSLLATLAWIGISVLVTIAFVGQATVVPTGSMQPTIMGAQGRTPGDHVFVEEFSYLFRDPRRFEIVVFQYPLDRRTLFVKRVVGLPGEHLEIRDGDLWVNGQIARKPRVVQSTMWQPLHPRGNRKVVDDFQSSGPWRPESPTRVVASPTGPDPTFLLFNGSDLAPDLRVAFRATPRASGAVALARITTRGTRVTLTVPAAGGGRLDVGGSAIPFDADLGAGAPIELCVADGEAWALVAGREVARAEVTTQGPRTNRVEIGANGGEIAFDEIHVDRDIQYEARGNASAWDVPKDGFFFIGDNQAGSFDSRLWTVSVFHPADGGAPVVASRDTLTETGAQRANIVNADGAWRFHDVDGVLRDLPETGTAVEANVPFPFATRSHLVGRAVLVFYPFPPLGPFRPRLLP